MSARDRIREFRRVPAKDLHPNPKNWRLHPKAQTSALLGMLAEIGFADACIAYAGTPPSGDIAPASEYLVLIDGHARVEISAPEDLIPTLILDVTEAEADKLLISIDTLTGMADIDRGQLATLVAGVDMTDDRATALLDRIRRDNRLPEARPAVDRVVAPEPASEPIARLGDIWTLGAHRIICGDATERATYDRLMGGEGASVLFTDPPYGVSYQGGDFDPIANDDKQRDQLVQFLSHALRHAASTLLPNAAFYVWHASATRYEFEIALRAAGLQELQYLIWAKPSLVLGHADYQWQHEPCFYGARRGEHPPFYGPRTETTVWRVGRGPQQGDVVVSLGNGVLLSTGDAQLLVTPAGGSRSKSALYLPIEDGETAELAGADYPDSDVWQISRDAGKAEHPTQKPVELAARAISNSSLRGQIILDAFLGSGTTLIAAEQTGRRCFAVELAPGYVDVAVSRWESLTGRKAVVDRPE